ncbi:MAG: PqqD family protein [Acidimicrobiales bacterium]
MVDVAVPVVVVEHAAELLVRRVLDGAIVLAPGASEAVVLNESAAHVLQLSEPGQPPAAIAERLAEWYDVDPGAIQRDVEDVVEELIGLGVLKRIA